MNALRIISMAALALTFVACDNEMNATMEPEQKGIHFTATIANPATKTTYTEDGATINVTWRAREGSYEGDKIALVHNGTVDIATVTAVDASGNATIEATITGSPSDDDDVALAYPADVVYSATPYDIFPFTPDPYCWDYSHNQDGTLEFIQNHIDFRIGTGRLAVSGETASLKASVAMPSLLCIWKLTLQDGATPTPNALAAQNVTFKINSTLVGYAESSPKSVYYFGMVPVYCVPPYVYPWEPSSDDLTITIEATVGSDTYTYTKVGDIQFPAGKYYQSTVTMTKTP